MKLSHPSRLQLTIQKIIFLLLFLSSIGMLAWISNHYTYQFDLTANKRHSLSGNSIDLLQLLDRPVTVHAYTTDDVTQKAVTEIIARYQRIKSDFEVRLLNPDIDLAEAQQDGIVMNKPFAFVIYYNGQMEHIASLSEQAISNALLRLNRRDNLQVTFLSGHGERDIEATDSRAYATLKLQLSDMGFNLQTVNLLENPLPENTRLLVIAAPSHPYLEGELAIINRFLDDGGNLLWLIDPDNEADSRTGHATSDFASPETAPPVKIHGLEKLAVSLGLQFHDGVVIDNNPDLRQTLNIQHPAIIPVTEYFPHIISNTIRYNTLFPLARGISPLSNNEKVNDWQAAALFKSAGKSWTEAGGISEQMTYNSGSGDIAGPITIAVALTRNAARDAEGDETVRNMDRSQQRVVVVGDSDFLSDTYIGAGANLNLGLNIFNWLIGDDDLISVETGPSPDTKLELDDTELAMIGLIFFLAIPLLLISFGFRIWYVRKNK
jgi:ABC-type uncharacterized transport system involved in gliding motility auxiliary subunit